MKPTITGHEAVNHHQPLVHNWRVSQFTRLGIPWPLAEAYADGLTGRKRAAVEDPRNPIAQHLTNIMPRRAPPPP